VPGLAAPALLLARLKDVAVGSPVLAVGHPQGLEFTVSDGIVSAVREIENGLTLIQITAPISPGNSGGPILDRNGRVLGMATAFFTEGQNLNFAVSAENIDSAMRVLEEPSAASPPAGPPGDAGSRTALSAPQILAQQARSQRKAKRFEAATQLVENGLNLSPKDLAVLLEATELAWDLGNLEEATKHTQKMLELDANYPPAHQCRGALLIREGRWEDARSELEQTISLGANPEYAAYAHTGLAQIALRARDFTKALVHIDQALSYVDVAKEPGFHTLRAFALLGVGRKSEASREASLALGLAPDDASVRDRLKSVGLPLGVRITSYSGSWDLIGNLIVKGVVVNEGESIARFARILAESLDENGTVVGTGYDYVNPGDLPPGTTGSFTIYIGGNPNLGKTYRVRVME
jgi:Flp pilus assembly protein TadD